MSSHISQIIRTSKSSLAKARSLKSEEVRGQRSCWEMLSRNVSNLPGSGAGKGGGGGGSIKDAGGGLGRLGAAREEGYFYEQEKEKLSKLKKTLKENFALRQKEKKPDK